MSSLLRFKWRLAETIAWCRGRASTNDPENCLRTLTFQPPPFDNYPNTQPDRQLIVDMLASKRAEILRLENKHPLKSAEDLADGQLLLYYPDANLCDGAAPAETNFFFDIDNIPPWDTWLCYVNDPSHEYASIGYGSYLVSWIPPEMLALADAGIGVNPEACIVWARNIDNIFIRELERAKLI